MPADQPLSPLARPFFFPAFRRGRAVYLMAPAAASSRPRLVAVADPERAAAALQASRLRPLEHVVGPMMRLRVPRLPADAGASVLWEATPTEVARGGVRSFVLDVCTFEPPGTLRVVTSFSVVLQVAAGPAERDALEAALRLPG